MTKLLEPASALGRQLSGDLLPWLAEWGAVALASPSDARGSEHAHELICPGTEDILRLVVDLKAF